MPGRDDDVPGREDEMTDPETRACEDEGRIEFKEPATPGARFALTDGNVGIVSPFAS